MSTTQPERPINNAFFAVKILDNAFSPRAREGEILLMKHGHVAEPGDLVAVGVDDGNCRHIEFYDPETEYFAVACAILRDANCCTTDDQLNLNEIAQKTDFP